MLTKHRPNIATLKRLLRSLAKLPQVGDIWQQGFMAGIELVKD
jgi:adenosylmethionine-8-amino-7-oxononanoate aminotransferase